MPVYLPILGRGATGNPANRFEPIDLLPDGDTQDTDRAAGESQVLPSTRFFKDTSRSIIAYNDSPDVGFDASINPYRGCEHGCAYCYARPTHEYLGLSAGLDFESKIFVKSDADELLRKELSSRTWRPQVLAVSGVTDAYQPVERRLEITRRCIAVLADFRNPVGIVTKNHLVTRDIDCLIELARLNAVRVHVSITSLRKELSMKLEPRASSPARRLDAVRALSAAGVPVGVLVSPVIPGLTDEEVPSILRAAANAGARWAGYIPLRLPGAVREVFLPWLRANFPDRCDKVTHRLQSMKQGRLNDPNFHGRFKATGIFAEQIRGLFHLARQKAGLSRTAPTMSIDQFRVPGRAVQGGLFD